MVNNCNKVNIDDQDHELYTFIVWAKLRFEYSMKTRRVEK